MAYPKENLEIPSPSIQHLVCPDSYCPRVSDPFTSRVICRCYQSANSVPGHIPMSPNFAAALFHTHMPGEIPSPVTSPMQPNPAIRWDSTTMASMGYGSFPGLAQQSIDNILRSQMYSYMHAGMDPNNARRKNATRETTAALKAWLKEHKKNPYPTKAEKIMLAIITRMTLTQVSTWFANARRRLKKENKGEFSSDISFDNISTSSDDEDNTKANSFYKTDSELNTEAATPEHELPGYSALNSDMYSYTSFSFHSSRPLTSTPIDHNMNNLPEYSEGENKTKCLNNNLKQSSHVEQHSKSEADTNKISNAKDSITETDKNSNDKNNTRARPKFLPPLISKPKIWSISNIIGKDDKDNSGGNEKLC